MKRIAITIVMAACALCAQARQKIECAASSATTVVAITSATEATASEAVAKALAAALAEGDSEAVAKALTAALKKLPIVCTAADIKALKEIEATGQGKWYAYYHFKTGTRLWALTKVAERMDAQGKDLTKIRTLFNETVKKWLEKNYEDD